MTGRLTRKPEATIMYVWLSKTYIYILYICLHHEISIILSQLTRNKFVMKVLTQPTLSLQGVPKLISTWSSDRIPPVP